MAASPKQAFSFPQTARLVSADRRLTHLGERKGPAFAQGTTVHWLRWSDLVPASASCSKADHAGNARRRRAHAKSGGPSSQDL